MSLLVEVVSPTYGFERLNLKIVKDYTKRPYYTKLRRRTRPKCGINGITIGRHVSYEAARDCLLEELEKNANAEGYRILNARLQK